MLSTWIALAQGYAAVCGFALFFLPPGYLVASLTNFNRFRDRSPAEKLLWSLCLSLPLSIELCVALGRHLPASAVIAITLVLAIAAAARLLTTRAEGPITGNAASRATKSVLLLAAGLAVFYILAVTDIAFGHHLYVSTVLYDWSVRVPMVDAAMRSGVPPVNPLSALDGTAAPLRYFYYWNIVCADLARLLHLPARACLAASSVWAAWSLIAALFLALKYLLGIQRNLRAHCAAAFLVCAVIGLDILPTTLLYLSKSLHPYLEIEWWHHDRTPSLLATPLYSPHHIAAFACLLTGILVLALTLRTGEQAVPRKDLIFASLFAGVCFSSAAGASVFPTFTIAIGCLLWVVDLIRQRQFPTIAALAGSAVLALLLARTFLDEVFTTTGAAASGSLLSLQWRNTPFVQSYLTKYAPQTDHHVLLHQALLQGAILVLNLFDLGFFFFVLLHRIRRDASRILTPAERTTWAFFLGAALPYFFLSSASIASPNDLGLDAGIFLRLLLQLWAVPWLFELWQQARAHRLFTGSPAHRAGLVLASICLVLGLTGELAQVLDERLYLPLVGSQTIHKQLDFLTADRLSERLYNIRDAYRQLDHTPLRPAYAASVQYNPISPMQPALTFYATHQIAAFDRGCGTGYGGDYALCNQIIPGLIELYGNTLDGVARARAGNDRQDAAAPTIASAADALAICRTLHLSSLIAESTDSIWSKPNSWVWTMQPLVTNSTVRVFACPKD